MQHPMLLLQILDAEFNRASCRLLYQHQGFMEEVMHGTNGDPMGNCKIFPDYMVRFLNVGGNCCDNFHSSLCLLGVEVALSVCIFANLCLFILW
jgi:hypothetical protein